MVKMENGVGNKEDMDGDCQELLSPPQPSSPTNSISHTSAKVTNGVANGNGSTDDDAEQEPLLQKAVKNKSEALTTPKTFPTLEAGSPRPVHTPPTVQLDEVTNGYVPRSMSSKAALAPSTRTRFDASS